MPALRQALAANVIDFVGRGAASERCSRDGGTHLMGRPVNGLGVGGQTRREVNMQAMKRIMISSLCAEVAPATS